MSSWKLDKFNSLPNFHHYYTIPVCSASYVRWYGTAQVPVELFMSIQKGCRDSRQGNAVCNGRMGGGRWRGSMILDSRSKAMGWPRLTFRSSRKKWHPLPPTLLWLIYKPIWLCYVFVYVCVCTCSQGAWKSSLQAKGFPSWNKMNQSINQSINQSTTAA